MQYFIFIISFIFGSVIGSFLNVLIYRLESFDKLRTGQDENGEEGSKKQKWLKSIFFGRSRCPHCKHQIRWYDNVPILSFLILRGKCRDCHSEISFQYPLVEAATGILFITIFNFIRQPADLISNFQFADGVILVYLFVVFSGLFAILIYDFKHYIIPNKILYPLILFVLAFSFLSFLNRNSFRNLKLEIVNFESWQGIALSLLIPIFFLSLIIISRGHWMGMGDVKLALFMALFLGWPNIIVAIFLAFWLGTLVSLPLLAFGKKGLKSQIPFGPFLIIGTFVAFFLGEQIIAWYLQIAF